MADRITAQDLKRLRAEIGYAPRSIAWPSLSEVMQAEPRQLVEWYLHLVTPVSPAETMVQALVEERYSALVAAAEPAADQGSQPAEPAQEPVEADAHVSSFIGGR
jgi:hypothetical protein